MRKYITLTTDGGIAITEISGADPDGRKLTKTLFELSRTTDMNTRFDPVTHTREAIASGITGHRTLELIAECEGSELPSDLYFRDAWEWSD